MALKPSIFAALLSSLGLLTGCSPSHNAVAPHPTVATASWETAPPIYLIDNVKVDDLKQAQINGRILSPNDISSIEVLKQQPELLARYGPQARNGVVLITTKKAGTQPTTKN